MIRDAVFADNPLRRFALIRDWTATKQPRTMNLIGHNPSLAGAVRDDPTIRKGVGFATRWGYTRLVMTNLNPFVSTDPYDLPPWKGFDQENLAYLRQWLQDADLIVAAWGSVPRSIAASTAFAEYVHWLMSATLREIYCIGRTQKGDPLHPSRAPYTVGPVIYREAIHSRAKEFS